MSNKIEFIVQVSGDSSIGDHSYAVNVILENDGRCEDDFIEQAKGCLSELYGSDYKVKVFTAAEFDEMIEYYQTQLENMQLQG